MIELFNFLPSLDVVATLTVPVQFPFMFIFIFMTGYTLS